MEAVIVAGGQGKRLGDAARGLPKALVDVAGRPLASYMLERLDQAGVTRVIVNCAQGSGSLFRERLSGLGPEIEIAEEPERLGRGGGLRFAAERLEGGDFFVLYGDELIDVDFTALLEQHRAARAALTVTSCPLTTPFGVLEMDEAGQVSDFREGGELPDHWVNVGVYVMAPETVALLPEQGDAEHELFPALARQGRLWAHRHSGVWLTVNTAKDLERLRAFMTQVDRPDNPWGRQRDLLADDAHKLREKARGALKDASTRLRSSVAGAPSPADAGSVGSAS